MAIFDRDLNDAVTGPIASAVPGVVMGHCLIVHYMNLDGEEHMLMAAPADQRLSHTLELLGVGNEVTGIMNSRKIEDWIDDEC